MRANVHGCVCANTFPLRSKAGFFVKIYFTTNILINFITDMVLRLFVSNKIIIFNMPILTL